MPTPTEAVPPRTVSRRLAVLGPGLIGGSILLAARARQPELRLSVWSRAGDELAEVRRRGLADVVTDDLPAAVRGADLVVLCTPAGAMASVAAEFAPHLEPDAVVTDVGSVKAPVVAALDPLLPRFVGGHPMAGRELAGLGAARADLFAGSLCFLTPTDRTLPAAGARVANFWKALGAGRVHALPATEHDELVALISHLPHIVAAVLLETVASAWPDGAALACSGPGLRSVTRPAAGLPELWTEILSLNRSAVASALRQFAGQLEAFAQCLEPGREAELAARLRSAAARRRELPELGQPEP
jgi:cyclohexadieny/prephenate dehydrogenase